MHNRIDSSLTFERSILGSTSSSSPALESIRDSMRQSNAEREAIFAELEEEEAEAARLARQDRSQDPEPATSGSFIARAAPKELVSASASVSTIPDALTTITTQPAPDSNFLPSFTSGFLARVKASLSTAVLDNAVGLQGPAAAESPVLYEPRHHSLPAAKSIYRATPPPSAPSTRPGSPRLDKRVAFDVPASEEKLPKVSKAIILLPAAPSTPSLTPPTLPAPAKTTFNRPIKENVVEHPIKPPQAPTIQKTSRLPSVNAATMGRPPKVAATAIGVPSAPPLSAIERAAASASTSIQPVHTISLSAKSSTTNGTVSVNELGPDDEEFEFEDVDDLEGGEIDIPSKMFIDSEEEDASDSSGFYAESDDEEDDEDFDVDGILHNREVALAYHQKRAGLGAGAGTGPLGGSEAPDAFNSWNQAVSSSFFSSASDAGLTTTHNRLFLWTLHCKVELQGQVDRDLELVDLNQLK
jgi:hypothetical protein